MRRDKSFEFLYEKSRFRRGGRYHRRCSAVRSHARARFPRMGRAHLALWWAFILTVERPAAANDAIRLSSRSRLPHKHERKISGADPHEPAPFWSDRRLLNHADWPALWVERPVIPPAQMISFSAVPFGCRQPEARVVWGATAGCSLSVDGAAAGAAGVAVVMMRA